MNKKFATAAIAALALTIPAQALAFRTAAYVQMSDHSSCSSCQYIVEQGTGTPWVVATGSGQSWGYTYYDAVLQADVIPLYSISYNAWTDHFTAVDVTYHMWARRPCGGGGYNFSPSVDYPFPSNKYEALVWGEVLNIDASHCQTQLPS